VGISNKLLNEGETVVLSTRTHVKALIMPVLVLIVGLVIGSAGRVYLPGIVALSTHRRVVLHDIPDVEQTQRTIHQLLDGLDDHAPRDEGV
jgi:hypothetical protein